jgi:hypothetical protein
MRPETIPEVLGYGMIQRHHIRILRTPGAHRQPRLVPKFAVSIKEPERNALRAARDISRTNLKYFHWPLRTQAYNCLPNSSPSQSRTMKRGNWKRSDSPRVGRSLQVQALL